VSVETTAFSTRLPEPMRPASWSVDLINRETASLRGETPPGRKVMIDRTDQRTGLS